MSSIPRPFWIPLFIILLLFLVALLWGYSRFISDGTDASTDNTIIVTRGRLAAFVTATGKLNTDSKARLAFPVAGTILTVAEVGTELSAGQPVATLQNPELQLRYDEAQAGLTVARAPRDRAM